VTSFKPESNQVGVSCFSLFVEALLEVVLKKSSFFAFDANY
jgi:hypothetical protein